MFITVMVWVAVMALLESVKLGQDALLQRRLWVRCRHGDLRRGGTRRVEKVVNAHLSARCRNMRYEVHVGQVVLGMGLGDLGDRALDV